MSKLATNIVTSVVSFLPFATALLFFSGDNYHDTHLTLWNADPSMFPESVADRISLGAQVITANVKGAVFAYILALSVFLFLLLGLNKVVLLLGRKIKPYKNRLTKKLFKGNKNENKDHPKTTELEIFAYWFSLGVFSCILIAVAFALCVEWAYSSSKQLAEHLHATDLARYNCSFKGMETCKKLDLKPVRLTKFTFTDGTEKSGFAAICSTEYCILYLEPSQIMRVSAGYIEKAESAATIIKR